MRNIKQLREYLEESGDKSDMLKLSALVRSGLFDPNKLTLLKRALNKDNVKMTKVERNTLLDLLDKLLEIILHNQSTFTKVKSNLTEDIDIPDGLIRFEEYTINEETETLEEVAGGISVSGGNPLLPGKNSDVDITKIPPIVIMKRRAIRVFPDGQKVALYWADRINKYISVPFQSIGLSEETLSEAPVLSRVQIDPLASLANPLPVSAPAPTPITPKKIAKRDSTGKFASSTPSVPEYKPGSSRPTKKALGTFRKVPRIRQDVKNNFGDDFKEIQGAGAGLVGTLAGAVGSSIRRSVLKNISASRVKQNAAGEHAVAYRNKNNITTVSDKSAINSDTVAQPNKFGGMTLPKQAAAKPKKTRTKAAKKSVEMPITEASPFAYDGKERPAPLISRGEKVQSLTPRPNPEEPDVYKKGATGRHWDRVNRKWLNTATQPGALPQQRQTQESLMPSIQTMLDNNIDAQDFTINEREITVTHGMAKKLAKLYETLNPDSKVIMDTKLLESSESFFKVLEFAVKGV